MSARTIPFLVAIVLVPAVVDPVAGAPAAPPQFVRWSHPTGLISAEVPAGWNVEGQLGDALDLGQFRINAYAPDGRSFVSFGHNWLSFMEFQYGPYLPGAATVERIVLPEFLRTQPEYVGARVTWRSANANLTMTNPTTGLPIPFDAGAIGFLLARADGGFSAGTAHGETMYIAVPGTPGLWRLRLFATGVAPAEEASQERVRAAIDRLVVSLDLSPQYFQLWNEAAAHTARQMREYSAQMDRVFSRYLVSAGRSASRSGNDPLEGWASMMRGGEYAADDATDQQYWVSNDRDYWYVNQDGTLHGNDTGDVPLDGGDWRPLRRIGQ